MDRSTDSRILKAEVDQLRIELDLNRRRSAEKLARIEKELAASEQKRAELERRVSGVEHAGEEQQSFKEWMEQTELDLSAAQERIGELQTRVHSLTQINGRLQIERVDLVARLEAAGAALPAQATPTQSTAEHDASHLVAELEDEVAGLHRELEATRNAAQERDRLRETVAELERRYESLKVLAAATETELARLRSGGAAGPGPQDANSPAEARPARESQRR